MHALVYCMLNTGYALKAQKKAEPRGFGFNLVKRDLKAYYFFTLIGISFFWFFLTCIKPIAMNAKNTGYSVINTVCTGRFKISANAI